MWHSKIAYKIEQDVWKKFFDSMFSLEYDEMTALGPNDSFSSTFYVKFSNCIPNWTIFGEVVFWFDV